MKAKSLTQWIDAHPEWQPYADLILSPPLADEVVEEFPELSLKDAESMSVRGSRFGPFSAAAHYIRMRREGESHGMASILAKQKSPGLNTDTTFWAGRPHLASLIGDMAFTEIEGELAKHGCKLGANNEYFPELARFPGDPEAVVHHSDGRAYIQKLCEKRGWACRGSVNVAGRGPDSDPTTPLAEDLVQESIADFRRDNPDEARKMDRQELRSHIISKHGFS